jgi:hypothetical protein
MPLSFQSTEAFYEMERAAMCWYGDDGQKAVLCKATCDAIGSLYKSAELTPEDYRVIFARHRMIFELAASRKFDTSHNREQRPVVVEYADISSHHKRYGAYVVGAPTNDGPAATANSTDPGLHC